MKKILICFSLLIPMILSAVTPVDFTMRINGKFLSSGNQDYAIVEFPGQTASQIYEELMMHALYLYIQPNNVVSSVEGKMIKARGHMTNINFTDANHLQVNGKTYYTIIFYIKDGKVKILAPELEKIEYGYPSKSITPEQLASFFEKSGNDDVKSLNSRINSSINYILGAEPDGNYPYNREW